MSKTIASLVGALLLTAAAWAHHGLATQFDMTEGAEVILTGRITEVLWRNPHIYFKLEVPQESGEPIVYNIESVPVAMARNAGLTAERLKGGGQMVDVTIRPALADPHLGFSVYLEYEDGFIVTFRGFKE